MVPRLIGLVGLVALGVAVAGCLESSGEDGRFDWSSREQWQLPQKLREISGLALTPDGRLLAHDDERAIVYELDYADGAVVKQFAFGDPPVEDDFEGIAATETHVYLVTSRGRMLAAREGVDGEAVPFQEYSAGTTCEIEGLAYVKARDELVLACKRPPDDSPDYVQIHFWSVAERAPSPTILRVDVTKTRAWLGTKRVRPSGIEWDAQRGVYLVVAGEERAVLEIDQEGNVTYVARLPRLAHRQTEGIALDSRGRLLLADEGGDGRARLATYSSRER